ncbi:NAD-dependent epimerase/dehydratase family protein [Candidatus Poribacteria bacterium]|nr:NAD-dependent epimerase/dehydratase family protein [Candidatus Poribacteria bacterium]
MNLLLLGGTVFLGRHVAASALARGHAVTLFHRGRHDAPELEGVGHVLGDRMTDLALLGGRQWDAAVDTCGYFPRAVRMSAEFLAERSAHYTFVSSLSVYADNSRAGEDETAATGSIADESIEDVTGDTYGPLKALCERAAEAAMPGRVLNARPGLIVGPHDPTDRFTYWVRRMARGGAVLAPGDPQTPVQFIDARDLAEWIVRCAESRTAGVFNACGPVGRTLTMGEFLGMCAEVTGAGARLEWVDAAFLERQNAAPWSDLPVWIPGDGDMAGFHTRSLERARRTGLRTRPLAGTIRDTLEWDRARGEPPLRAGLAAEREGELLEAWRAR